MSLRRFAFIVAFDAGLFMIGSAIVSAVKSADLARPKNAVSTDFAKEEFRTAPAKAAKPGKAKPKPKQ